MNNLDIAKDLAKENPILLDLDFQRRYPNVLNVALYLFKTNLAHMVSGSSFGLFDKLGLETVGGFINLLSFHNEEAIRNYEMVRELIEDVSRKYSCIYN